MESENIYSEDPHEVSIDSSLFTAIRDNKRCIIHAPLNMIWSKGDRINLNESDIVDNSFSGRTLQVSIVHGFKEKDYNTGKEYYVLYVF